MMNHPPLNDLMSKVGCRYTLVTAVAKRARQLLSDQERLGDEKPESLAVEELYKGKLKITSPEESGEDLR